MDPSNAELLVHINYARADIAGVHDRLDQLNGRTRKSESAIAVLQWAVGLIGIVALALLTAYVQSVWP